MKTLLFSLALFVGCGRHSNNPDRSYYKTMKNYATSNYNQQIVFYADLSRPSSGYRFYVLDLVHNAVLANGLCCKGKTDRFFNVLYSNAGHSNCSSKGLYQIGPAYTGQFGKVYRLYGLSSTNSNALNRGVVLHPHRCVPFYPSLFPIAESKGCPTVNAIFFKVLDLYITRSDKPIRLYIE